jgi:hypothetical protein
VVPVCDQGFLLGRHAEVGGCFAATFGSLTARRSYLHFGDASPPLLWRLRRKVTGGAVFRCFMILSLLYTVLRLAFTCYTVSSLQDPHHKYDPVNVYHHHQMHSESESGHSQQQTYTDSIVALCVTSYLLLTAFFACRKAQLLSTYDVS